MSFFLITLVVFVILVLFLIFIFEFTGLLGAPYVPSNIQDVNLVFNKLYMLSERDTLVDFGSGDGKVLALAAKKDAKAIGIEINPLLVIYSKIKYFGNKKIRIYCKNMYTFKLPPDTTIIYVYGNTLVVNKIYKVLKKESNRLKKDLFLITNAFDCKNITPVKHIGPYYLYNIKKAPAHRTEANDKE